MEQKFHTKKVKKESERNLNHYIQPTISKLNPLPYYLQLKNVLMDEIKSGKMVGTIPSERELSEQFHLNRATVRHCLNELVKEGIILKRKGQPTVIIPPHHMERDYASELISFTEEMLKKGLTPSSKVLRFEKLPADKDMAGKLNIKVGDEIVVLERIRYGNQKPFNLGISYLPFSICPTIFQYNFNHESLHLVLKSAYGIDLVMSHESFEPSLPTKEEAELLQIPLCSPILLMEGITYASDGRPVEYFILKFRGDKAKFNVKVFRK